MNLELFSKGSKLKVSPSKSLSSFKSFIEGYTQGLESSADAQQEQDKISLFAVQKGLRAYAAKESSSCKHEMMLLKQLLRKSSN